MEYNHTTRGSFSRRHRKLAFSKKALGYTIAGAVGLGATPAAVGLLESVEWAGGEMPPTEVSVPKVVLCDLLPPPLLDILPPPLLGNKSGSPYFGGIGPFPNLGTMLPGPDTSSYPVLARNIEVPSAGYEQHPRIPFIPVAPTFTFSRTKGHPCVHMGKARDQMFRLAELWEAIDSVYDVVDAVDLVRTTNTYNAAPKAMRTIIEWVRDTMVNRLEIGESPKPMDATRQLEIAQAWEYFADFDPTRKRLSNHHRFRWLSKSLYKAYTKSDWNLTHLQDHLLRILMLDLTRVALRHVKGVMK